MDNIKVEKNCQKSFSIVNNNHKKVADEVKIKVYNRNYYYFKKFEQKSKYVEYYKTHKHQIKMVQDLKKPKLPQIFNKILIKTIIDFS
mgnify:CR=1 FL=1|tara:strand:- start:706 stop:969 length:264 start_codon:yes stop_codon:yes gene_type:complete